MQTYKIGKFSNSSRHQINIRKPCLSKTNKIVKGLMFGIKQNKGRSATTGRITTRHRGGGVKRLFRYIDFMHSSENVLILSVCYDPFRNSFLSLNFDIKQKSFFYSLATKNVSAGALITTCPTSKDLRLGNRLLITNIPVGSLVHSISSNGSKKICYIRAAGTFGQIIQKDLNFAKVKLPSGKILTLNVNNIATLGTLDNTLQNVTQYGKAGKRRLLGFRPSVRGIAMNPVDHPHGGRTNGGMPSVTPWGIPTKGHRTVKNFNRI